MSFLVLPLLCLLQMTSLLMGKDFFCEKIDNLLNFLSLFFTAVPPETCLVSQSCTSYCQSFGYGRGQCRTKVQLAQLNSPLSTLVSPVNRYCQCSGCDGGYCRHYCHRVGRKYAGCMCFNFAQRIGLLSQRATGGDIVGLANDCSNDVLYCQCTR